jgi:hypothetical protein
MSSYDFLLPGETESAEMASKVIFRCRFHGHTCLGDGSVQQAATGARASVK